MTSADISDREQLDQATSLLMASLRESRALNIEIRQALEHQALEHRDLQRREQPDAADGADPSSTSLFRILRDIIDGDWHP